MPANSLFNKLEMYFKVDLESLGTCFLFLNQ